MNNINHSVNITPYGAYRLEILIEVTVTEAIITNEKTTKYKSTCSCIINKSDYDSQSCDELINAMRKYCESLNKIKKISSLIDDTN